MRHSSPNLLPGWLVILFTALAFGAALCVFALFHHVLPTAGGQPIVHISPPALNSTPTLTAPTPTPAATPLTTDAGPTPVPTPTIPVATHVGDFTPTFINAKPLEIDGEVICSYSSDQILVDVYRVARDNNTCFIADIWIKDIKNFQTAFAKDTFGRNFTDRVDDMAAENDAIIALSGDYYGARSTGLVIRNSNIYRDSFTDDICVLYWDGVMRTYAEKDFTISEALESGAYQAWDFGPYLLENGQVITDFHSTIERANPRGAIGYFEPGHYCFVAVDGRQAGYSEGMTLQQLSQLFYDLGCTTAYNLDGGQSAMMASREGLISQPAGGGRKISDIIFIKEVE